VQGILDGLYPNLGQPPGLEQIPQHLANRAIFPGKPVLERRTMMFAHRSVLSGLPLTLLLPLRLSQAPDALDHFQKR
jgi:hypothetical protein